MILKQPDSHPERCLQRALHVATGLLRWIVPDSSGVAHATQDIQDTHGELPEQLKDPFAVFDRNPQSRPSAIIHSGDVQLTVDTLNLLVDKNINAE